MLETWLEGLGAAHFQQSLEKELSGQEGKQKSSRKGAVKYRV